VYTTDGLNIKTGLKVLEDDKGFFPDYFGAYIVRGDLLEKYPEVEGILEQLTGKISTQQMTELTYQVDVEGRTVDEVARQAGLSRREVNAALESVVEPISLEEPLYTDGGDAMYVIDQVRDPDSEDSWISGLEFRQTVAGLTPREKRIMELRYLKGETQMEVAREIGISQAQVSRLEKAALEQFRHK
uniref:sigma-70 family RNA polymerase sigma factor n=1 Tax=Faecalibacterium sp. TaxID=1971605 RepID=UPI003FEF21EA